MFFPFSDNKNRRLIQPAVREKINSALHLGNVGQLTELIIDGFGQELLGRTSFGEDARKLLKNIPHSLESIRELQEAVINGDQETLGRILTENAQFARVRDSNSFTLLHLAVVGGQMSLVNYLVENHPTLTATKDNVSGFPAPTTVASAISFLFLICFFHVFASQLILPIDAFDAATAIVAAAALFCLFLSSFYAEKSKSFCSSAWQNANFVFFAQVFLIINFKRSLKCERSSSSNRNECRQRCKLLAAAVISQFCHLRWCLVLILVAQKFDLSEEAKRKKVRGNDVKVCLHSEDFLQCC